MRFSNNKFLLTVVLLCLTSVMAFGQGIVSGSISGTVVDQQGAAVVGAKVVAKDPATNREFTGTTNEVGLYRISGLPVGTYSLTITAPNFSGVSFKDVVVNSNRDTALAATQLKVGGENVAVTVEDAAPIIETSTSQVASSFDAKKFAEIPVGAGNFDRLALLIPGVANNTDSGFGNTNGADLSVNGQRTRSNNFQLDGQSNNDNSVSGPQVFINNPDLIAEFQVVTNNFSAEYGRNMGSVVNYVTKSGSNAFHGSAFEFYTGNWADARVNEERSGTFGYCNPDQALNTPTPYAPGGCGTAPDPVTGLNTKKVPDVPRFVDNRFGGSLGGPIWKDKAWFFGSYVNQRTRQTQTPFNSTPGIVPTPAGIASLAAAFPGSPAVAALQAFGPYAIAEGNPTPLGNATILNISDGVTSTPVEFAGVTRSLPLLQNAEQWSVRGDWQISNKDRFFARYVNQENIVTNASGLARGAVGAVVDVPSLTRQIGLDYTRSWTNNFVQQLRFSYSRADVGFEGGPLDCLRAGILSCNSSIQFAGTGNTNANFGLQNTFPQGRLVNNTQYQSNNTWVLGRHTLKFGGEYDRQRSPSTFLPSVNGIFTFAGSGANGDCATLVAAGATAASGTACAFSNFIANRPSQMQITDGPFSFNFKEQDLAFYLQDDWKVRDNLTLNLGLRWEWNQQAVNLLHNLTTAQQTGSSPFWDTTLPLDRTTVPAVPEDLNNWGPNVGFAYTPRFWKSLFGEDKTVIRGGFRIAYDPSFYNIFLNMATAAPVVNAGSLVGLGVAPGLPGVPSGESLRAAGFLGFIPTGADPGTRAQTQVTSNFHNPYSEQWSFGVQREVTRNVAYEISYVGNHTVGNFQSINANPLINTLATDFPSLLPAGITPCATAGAPGLGRVDCNRRLVRVRANTAFSIYHSLQQQLRVQNYHGVTASFSHTWSRAIDNASEIFGTLAGGNTNAFAANPFDPNRGERALSGNSFPHLLSFFYIYELPFSKNQSGIMGKILGGWQWNGTWNYSTGQPWTPNQTQGTNNYCDAGFDTQFIGWGSCRPFLSNPNAAVDAVGLLCDGTVDTCPIPGAAPGTFVAAPLNTPVSFYDPCLGSGGDPTTACAVGTSTLDAFNMIYNDQTSALFFGNPFGNYPRNRLFGQSFNQWNMGLFKNTKITEKVKIQLQANVLNVFNRQFRGTPDPLVEDGNLASLGTFGNNFSSVATPTPVRTRRRLELGLKIIF
jgi:outer membrane receptor protein involved in Fe transport